MENLPQTLIALWQGKQPLWVAFWVWGHGVYGLLLGAFIAMYKLSFDAFKNVEFGNSFSSKMLQILGSVVNAVDWSFVIMATIFFSVSIWRSAPNTDWVWAGWLARGYIIWFWMFILLGSYLLIKGRI